MSKITGLHVHDIRFPTSRDHSGSDAMNPAPDYSAAYVEVTTDALDGLVGTGFVFTIGRGNEVQESAIAALRGHVVGADAEAVLADMAAPGARWCTTRSCAGSGRRRASCTWRSAPSSTPCGTSGEACGAAAVGPARRPAPRGSRRPGGLPVPDRRDHPGRGARTVPRRRTDACRTSSAPGA